MSDWALAIELAASREQYERLALEQRARQAQTTGSTNTTSTENEDEEEDANMVARRLTVTLNTANPPSRQLLTVVKCCHCGHRCGLPTDYSTPYQCLGYSVTYQQTSTSTETPMEQRIACRHVYCLGCEWLVAGEFRRLHPIEIRDDTQYDEGQQQQQGGSGYGYGYAAADSVGQQAQAQGQEGARKEHRGSRRSR